MNRKHLLSLFSLTLLSVPALVAQGGPPQENGAGGQAGAPAAGYRGGEMGMRGGHEGGRGGGFGMGIVPPGMWWKSPEAITRLGLTPDQQKRMDDIFHQSRIQLIDLKASLEKEQLNLEPLLNANPPDQGRTLGEISKIADLRADLEKANAKMLLGLRGVLTADQWTKMQDHRRNMDGHGMRPMGGQDGGRGQRGMDGGNGRPPAPPAE